MRTVKLPGSVANPKHMSTEVVPTTVYLDGGPPRKAREVLHEKRKARQS